MNKYQEAEMKMKEAGECNVKMLDLMDVLNMEFITGTKQAEEFKQMLVRQLKDLRRCRSSEDFYYIMNRRSE